MSITALSGDHHHLPPLVLLDIDDVICINAPYGGYDVFAPKPAECPLGPSLSCSSC